MIWACVILVLVQTGTFFSVFASAFLEAGPSGHDNSGDVFLNPVSVASLIWTGLVAYRLAKALNPRLYYYGTVTALMLPLGPIVVIYLFVKSGDVLIRSKIYG